MCYTYYSKRGDKMDEYKDYEEIEEEEEYEEYDPFLEAPCDLTGYCGGWSCPYYHDCKG
jgi:hypothetical protein